MRIRRLLLIGALALLFVVVVLFGAALYLYHHPSPIKSLVERSISNSLRGFTTIEHLSFSLRPLKLEARGVVARGTEEDPDLYIELPELVADMKYLGPFRHRRLVLEDVTITNPSLRLDLEQGLPRLRTQREPSFFSRIVTGIIQSLLISDIQVKKSRVTDGRMRLRWKGRELRVQELHARVAEQKTIVSCRAELVSPSEDIRLDSSRVHITVPGVLTVTGTELGGEIRIRDAVLESPYLSSADMDLNARLSYNRSRKEIRLASLRVQMAALLPFGQAENPVDLTVEAEGSVDLEQEDLQASRLYVSVPDLASIRGSGNGALGPEPEVNFALEEGRLVPQNALVFLPENLQKDLPGVPSGAVVVAGRIRGEKKEQWQWTCDLETRLTENEIVLAGKDILFESLLSGTIRFSGPVPGVLVHSEITGKQTALQGDTWGLDPFGWRLTLDGTYPSFRIPAFEARIPQARLSVGGRDQTIQSLHVQVKDGNIQLQEQSFSLPNVQLDSGLLKNLLLKATARGSEFQLEARGDQVGLMQCLHGLGWIDADWQMSADDRVEANLTQETDGTVAVQARIHLKNLSLQNPQGTFMGDNLSIDLALDAQREPSQSVVSNQGVLEIPTGELLYDRFYGSFDNMPLRSTWKATYQPPEKSLKLSDLQLELQDVVRLHMEAAMVSNPMDLHMRIHLPKTPVPPLYDLFLLDPFQAEKPFLTELDVTGAMKADIQIRYGERHRSLKGNLFWEEGGFSIQEGQMEMGDIHLELPLWLTEKGDPSPGALQDGYLTVGSVLVPYLRDQPLRLTLRGGPNTLEIREPTSLHTIGGEVQVGPVYLRVPWNGPPRVSTSLMLDELDLGPFLSRLWPHPIEGNLAGELKPVHLKGNELTTTGRLTARAFGGKITLDHLGASGLMTPAPVYKLEAEFEGLRLGQLTQDTSFGKIRGILQGHIHNLEIAYGQPQRFDMILETVKTKGLPQRISVQAVDNIAQIGGGRSPFMGMAGNLAALFKDFPYEKMGIHATLENDVFRINGTIREGETEYLVKRGGLSGVNVVNQNPDNRIRFQDMVKRVKRISSPGKGPVIQ